MFTGREPTALQARLYEGFPGVLGFSSQDKIPEQLEAVAMLGIAQTWQQEGEEAPNKVFFLVPNATSMLWCLEVLKTMAKDFFQTVKERPVPKDTKIKVAKTVGDLFNHLQIGIPRDAEGPPERWVAFGYLHTDAAQPSWIRSRLLVP